MCKNEYANFGTSKRPCLMDDFLQKNMPGVFL